MFNCECGGFLMTPKLMGIGGETIFGYYCLRCSRVYPCHLLSVNQQAMVNEWNQWVIQYENSASQVAQ